jgi:dipeptidyl aminopeptidase/acylaminoacyl peptidase
VDAATGVWSELTVPEPDPRCLKYAYEEPERLPDGRLGLIARCDSDPVSFIDELYIDAYEPSNNGLTRLTHFLLPSQHAGVGGYSWGPKLERGITNDRNGAAEKLYWLTPNDYEFAELGFSRAVTAVWEPNGHRVAFWGTHEQGLQGTDKAQAVFNLYVMDEDGTDVRQVLSGFRFPYSMTWSPDARALVFVGTDATSGKQGIWRLDMTKQQLHLLGEGRYRVVTFSPLGNHIGAIVEEGNEAQPDLRILTMSGVSDTPLK